MNLNDKAKEAEKLTDSILMPFLGTIDNEPFQYLIIDISLTLLKIAIPQWLVSRYRLKINDIINFHIYFCMDEYVYNEGKVVWVKFDDTIPGELYGIQMGNKVIYDNQISISLKTSQIKNDLKEFYSLKGLFIKIINEIRLFKKDILISLKHLLPYFSQITNYSENDYAKLKEVFLEDIIEKIKNNYDKLNLVYQKAQKSYQLEDEIDKDIDLEELRDMVESEINIDIFKTTFENDAVMSYLNAIKLIEKKQYDNYNTIVLLYIDSLKKTF
ncbi:MAG: hypothetical protein HQK79_15595 [Desulfobacterales bacterium]|nr:hypothetical protein [Desulfobacterales bacterium]